MTIVGPKYATTGASIAFHKNDHGLAAIENRGTSLSPGSVNTIDLETWMVKFSFDIYLLESLVEKISLRD